MLKSNVLYLYRLQVISSVDLSILVMFSHTSLEILTFVDLLSALTS